MRLREAIRLYIEASGVPMSQVADQMGVNYKTLHHYLTGYVDTSCVTFGRILKWMLEEDDDQNQD